MGLVSRFSETLNLVGLEITSPFNSTHEACAYTSSEPDYDNVLILTHIDSLDYDQK